VFFEIFSIILKLFWGYELLFISINCITPVLKMKINLKSPLTPIQFLN